MISIKQLNRQITQNVCLSHMRENILDFTYKSNKNNTICLINATPKQRIKAEDIIVGNGYEIIEIQANKDNNNNLCYYYIIKE